MYVIFGRKSCKWCVRAQQLLEKRIGYFKMYNANSDVFHQEYSSRIPANRKHRSVPIIFYNHIYIGGFDDLVQKHFAHVDVDAEIGPF